MITMRILAYGLLTLATAIIFNAPPSTGSATKPGKTNGVDGGGAARDYGGVGAGLGFEADKARMQARAEENIGVQLLSAKEFSPKDTASFYSADKNLDNVFTAVNAWRSSLGQSTLSKGDAALQAIADGLLKSSERLFDDQAALFHAERSRRMNSPHPPTGLLSSLRQAAHERDTPTPAPVKLLSSSSELLAGNFAAQVQMSLDAAKKTSAETLVKEFLAEYATFNLAGCPSGGGTSASERKRECSAVFTSDGYWLAMGDSTQTKQTVAFALQLGSSLKFSGVRVTFAVVVTPTAKMAKPKIPKEFSQFALEFSFRLCKQRKDQSAQLEKICTLPAGYTSLDDAKAKTPDHHLGCSANAEIKKDKDLILCERCHQYKSEIRDALQCLNGNAPKFGLERPDAAEFTEGSFAKALLKLACPNAQRDKESWKFFTQAAKWSAYGNTPNDI